MMRGTKTRTMPVRLARSGIAHAAFIHSGTLHPRFIHPTEPYPQIIPITPNAPHMTEFASRDDPYEGIFHLSITEARKVVGGFKFVSDDDYSIVESFLIKTFKKKKLLSASAIADALGMDYGDLREVLARMIMEGKLGVK